MIVRGPLAPLLTQFSGGGSEARLHGTLRNNCRPPPPQHPFHRTAGYHDDTGSARTSIEGRGSPPILASKARNR